MSIFLDKYFSFLFTKKNLAFILINTVITTSFIFVSKSNGYTHHYDLYNLNVVNQFGQLVLLIPLGLLLTLYSLFLVINSFSINRDNGILLTHIAKPISRTKYLLITISAIYLSLLTITIINITMTYAFFMLVFNLTSISLFKMYISSILYACIHIIYLLMIFLFFSLIIQNTEFSIIASILFLLIYHMTFINMDLINSISKILLFDYEKFIFGYFYNDLFKVFVFNNHFIIDDSIININNLSKYNQLLNHLRFDEDLGFVPKIDEFYSIKIFIKSLLYTVLIQTILFFISIFRFKRLNIQGN